MILIKGQEAQNMLPIHFLFQFPSYTLCFAAYLMWSEIILIKSPKTYLNILCELGLALHIAILHLLEIGGGGNNLAITGMLPIIN